MHLFIIHTMKVNSCRITSGDSGCVPHLGMFDETGDHVYSFQTWPSYLLLFYQIPLKNITVSCV
jgi:hypothetical protein